jgi:hypothetical protein
VTWKPSPLGFTFLALGVFFTTVEVWGTYDFFLRDQGEFNYIVLAGCGVALACAFLAPAADTAWRNGWYWGAGLALLALPLALAVIVYAGVQRTGGATDAAQQGTKHVESNRKGWEKTEKEAEADLAVDKQTVATECASGWRKRCSEAKEAQAHTQMRLDDARAQLRKIAPPNSGDAASKRLAAISFGYLTEDQVRLYQPLLLPVLVTILATLFLAGGLRMDFVKPDEAGRSAGFRWRMLSGWTGRRVKPPNSAAQPASRQQPLDSSPAMPAAGATTLAPNRNVVALKPRKPTKAVSPTESTSSINGKVVVEFLRQCVPEAEGERVEWGEIFQAFRKWCVQEDVDPLNGRDFGVALDHICNAARWQTATEGELVYCIDRKVSGV